jgi:RNA polymerase sigma-70 factor (ECF subfamily)
MPRFVLAVNVLRPGAFLALALFVSDLTTIATALSSESALPGENLDRVNPATARIAALGRFLETVERRALRMAELATASRDEALDLVQDAMFGFVRHYADKPASEWTPLFYRVLDNRLNDWHRRRRVRSRWTWSGTPARADDEAEATAQVADPVDPGPLLRLAGTQAAVALDAALGNLPLRQRQAFLLRVWEGFDVATTAATMRCSQGSVKTHLSRALIALRRALEQHQ